MLTGVEIAGLALATFPIAVDGLRRMVEGVETIRYWRRYRVKLEDYACDLEAARVYYLDTLEELLMGIVESDAELAVLIDEPGGIAWRKPEYEGSLRRRLDRSYDTYLHILNRMRNALIEMREKLGFDESGKVLWDDYPTMYREMKRLKLTLSKNIYVECLQQIGKANKDLRDFTHQNVYLEAVRVQRRSKRLANDWKLIRAHAASLYKAMVLGTSLKCQCEDRHLASLRLDAGSRTEPEQDPSGVSQLRFRFLHISMSKHEDGVGVTARTFQDLEVVSVLESNNSADAQPSIEIAHKYIIARLDSMQTRTNYRSLNEDSSARTVRFAPIVPSTAQRTTSGGRPAPSTGVRIVDMCKREFPALEPKKPIGFLVDGENEIYKHIFYRTGTFGSASTYSLSLAEILTRTDDRSRGRYWYVPRGHRIRIAAILASSVLQLNGTSWLENEWTSDDIMFHWRPPRRAVDEDSSYEHSIPDFQQPYLSWKQCPKKSRTPSAINVPRLRTHMIRNRMLFALGLTLVELCFGKTLTSLRTGEDENTNETAMRSLDSVYDEMGGQYGDVVRRCLLQPFDVRELRLDNEEVQHKIFNDIVTPLAQNLRSFGGTLDI